MLMTTSVMLSAETANDTWYDDTWLTVTEYKKSTEYFVQNCSFHGAVQKLSAHLKLQSISDTLIVAQPSFLFSFISFWMFAVAEDFDLSYFRFKHMSE